LIITRTPFRVSFFGGGSDLSAFYTSNQGAVLSTSIDRYMYLSAHPYFDRDRIHLKYSRTETVADVAELAHPIVRRVMERLGVKSGIEIASTADIPAGTGLGSSSAFTVGMLHLLYAYQGRSVSPGTLAAEASAIEIEDLGAPIGKQDQYASAYGGLNFIRFFSDESVDVAPLVISTDCRRRLQESLLMFFTGKQRSASAVLAEQKVALTSDDAKRQVVRDMVDLAYRARALLENDDVEGFGRLLDRAWALKRTLTDSVSTALVDDMYERAMSSGAWGGKLLGAGGGGFLLFAAPVSAHAAIREALRGSRELPIQLDRGGSKVVYVSDGA
jgi:D-glycero-alpha-D-manno-heptose-7-phosphate kinase